MDSKNKDKIKNIITRSFRSLPIAQDLPRLVTQLRVFEGTKQVYPSNATLQNNPNMTNFNVTKNLYELVAELSRLLVGADQHKLVSETFPNYFKLWMKETSAEKPITTSKAATNDGLDRLQDPRLKEALLFLTEAFSGSTQDAVFLFNLDKPTAQVGLWISPSGVKIKEGNPSKDGSTVDCTISCSSALLTAILTGGLEPSIALRAGHLIVDNLPKLMVFAQAFKLDKKAFEQFKSKVKIAPSVEDIQQQQQDTTAIGQTLCKYFGEVLGEENRVVKILKACNSATISPAIIELKMTLGTNYMTKDVNGSWKFDLVVTPDQVLVKTRKSEQDLKNLFAYTWELELKYGLGSLECEDIQLKVINLALKEQCSDTQREDIKRILGAYGNPNIVPADTDKSKSDDEMLQLIKSFKEQQGESIRVYVYPNGDRYEGEFNDKGQRHGKGIYTTPGGDVYIGTYKNNVKDGYGAYTMKDGTRYKGEFKNGLPSGHGTYVFENGDIYVGEFVDDEFHGTGSWSSHDGSSYQGQFYKGQRHGRGVSFSKGSTYDGDWEHGVYSGDGIYLYANGDMYEGSFKNGKFNGFGKYSVNSTGQFVEGEFKDGKPVHVGVETKKQEVADVLDKQKIEQWKEQNQKIIEERKKHRRSMETLKP